MADWFEPKRYGYGAGLPIAWQGWALLIGYTLLMTGSVVLVWLYSWPVFVLLVTALTIAFLVVVKRTTRGGWRWRSGDVD